jgi:hypothetical protein
MARKSVIAIITQVSNELNLPSPSVVVSSQTQTVLKLFYLMQAVCDDLLHEYDWNTLQQRYTFSTVNGQSIYPWPSDYYRSIDGTFFDQTNRWPLKGSLTPTQWEIIQTYTISVSPFERFRVFNNQINLYPVPSTTQYTFVFDYISNNYVLDGNSGLPKGSFTQDSDVCMFDHRLMVYGIKLKYLAGIGQSTDMAVKDYGRALQLAKAADIPGQRISLMSGKQRLISTDNYADGNWTASNA